MAALGVLREESELFKKNVISLFRILNEFVK
jgi:hypothetical protein